MRTYRIVLSLVTLCYLSEVALADQRPKLTLVIVIDQFASHYMKKLRPHFTHGLKKLFDDGIVYTNIRFPHAMPATAVGHTCLNTGVKAKDHGIINNYWYDDQGNKILSDHDTSPEAAVFARDGLLREDSHSAKNTLVDGISDNYMLLRPTYESPRSVYALSMKSRSSIGMGNKKGKNIWFDDMHGYFTSSKAFFDELPSWLTSFNETYCSDKLKHISWKTCYPIRDKQYAYPYILNYDYCGYYKSLIDNNCEPLVSKTPSKSFEHDQSAYKLFLRTPAAADLLVKLAKACIDNELKENPNKELLLWVSFSNLDKVGHIYGPDCLEAIDTVYHLDRQVEELINYAKTYICEQDLCIALTSDHGSMSIPEIIAKKGYPAKRVNTTKIIDTINARIQEEFGVDAIITGFKSPQFFIHEKKLASLPTRERRSIVRRIKKYLTAHPDIKNCWTFNELKYLRVNPGSLEENFAHQLYPNRSGRFTCQTHPYRQFTRWENGTGHRTGYHYDTHVPLVIYQQGRFEKKNIAEQLCMTQFAPTIARILEIPKPSACIAQYLPGLF